VEIHTNMHYNIKYSYQRRHQPFTLPMQVALINGNPVLRTGFYRVDDTLGVAMLTPAVSDTNAGRVD